MDDRFAAIVSSHNIEHQPDLVRHLIMAENLLSPEGRYFLLVPDKRFCFDHFLAETTIADVLTAYSRAARVHDLGHVIEHRAMTTHNDTGRHWAGDHGGPAYETNVAMLEYALREHRDSAGGYVDVHAWKFTPRSFATLTGLLHQIGLTRLRPTVVYNTVRSRNEFCAILTKGTEA